LRYILAFGLSLHDAEDVLQEVFLSLFDHLKQGKPRNNLRGWLFRVSHNLALKRRTGSKSADPLPDLTLTDPAPNPEQQALSRHMQARLHQVYSALGERDRCCLLLRAEGLRYREIAATLNISLGTVSASLTRSLARLSTVYEGESS
jgi:RNA polymerase sigma-70 factor (ECF subfamily)